MTKKDFLLSATCGKTEASFQARYDGANSDAEHLSLSEFSENLQLAGYDGKAAGQKLFEAHFQKNIKMLYERFADNSRGRADRRRAADAGRPLTGSRHAPPWERLHDGTDHLAVHGANSGDPPNPRHAQQTDSARMALENSFHNCQPSWQHLLDLERRKRGSRSIMRTSATMPS